jgi:hypothetical protein
MSQENVEIARRGLQVQRCSGSTLLPLWGWV